MRYDYQCKCGREEERNVPFGQRDAQLCSFCKRPMCRQCHFKSVAVAIPLDMQAKYQDEFRNMLPDDPIKRKESLETVYANTGRRRQDLE